ncbi:MAG: transpeptidase family protein [Fimbriimonadaceae bacterium]|nr:transpeptidase family protein [Chitinophagales bacterium]
MRGVKKDILWRLNLALVLIALVGVAVIFQIGKIQFIDGDKYRAQADSVHVKYVTLNAERGNIYADGGNLLAASFPYYNIIMDPLASSKEDFSKYVDSLAFGLSKVYGDKSKSEYKQIITSARKNGKRYVVLYKKATVPQMEETKKLSLFRKGKYTGGLIIETFDKRVYPYGSLANRTIGYTNKEGIKVGLEGAYDKQLSGISGKQLMQKITGGTWLPMSDDAAVEPLDGMDVITTLDVNIQDITETALRRSLVKNNAAWGTAIVMEVKTGKIKAIANLTKAGESIYNETLNYAVAQGVEPGSTFKLFSLMCLFDDNKVDINDTVNLNGGILQYHGGTMYDSEPHHRYNVSVKTAFALSSNVGISRLVNDNYKNDKQKFAQHFIDAGLINKTGVEVAGEGKPVIKTDPEADNWYATTLPWMSVGYELQITPLQLLTFYNAIANDGKMMKPYLVEATKQYGENIQEFKPVVLKEKLCSDNTIRQLKICLEAVVDSGTARNLKNEYYDFAGKTGTAQLIENGHYVHKYLASFAGYFPAENPKYSIIVCINAPSNGAYYGGAVSAPVFREIGDKLFSHHLGINEPINATDSLRKKIIVDAKGYKYDLHKILSWLKINADFDNSAEWVAMQTNTTGIQTQTIADDENKMPSVKGMGLRDALFILENKGLTVNPIGRGKVVSQSIEAGQFIQSGNYVLIVLN